jgi:hypothetical protein
LLFTVVRRWIGYHVRWYRTNILPHKSTNRTSIFEVSTPFRLESRAA